MTVIMIDNAYGNPHHEGETVHVRACPVYGGVALVFADDETEIHCSETTMFNIMRAIAEWGGCHIYTPGENGKLLEWKTEKELEAQAEVNAAVGRFLPAAASEQFPLKNTAEDKNG